MKRMCALVVRNASGEVTREDVLEALRLRWHDAELKGYTVIEDLTYKPYVPGVTESMLAKRIVFVEAEIRFAGDKE